MSEYTILPLINAAFQPGEAKKMVDSFEDRDFQEIARAEYYYFTGQAEECNHIAERYLMSHNIKLKMSSCLLYVYSNLTLGREAASRTGLSVYLRDICPLCFCIFRWMNFRMWSFMQ